MMYFYYILVYYQAASIILDFMVLNFLTKKVNKILKIALTNKSKNIINLRPQIFHKESFNFYFSFKSLMLHHISIRYLINIHLSFQK